MLFNLLGEICHILLLGTVFSAFLKQHAADLSRGFIGAAGSEQAQVCAGLASGHRRWPSPDGKEALNSLC